LYLTSRRIPSEIKQIKPVLKMHDFPEGKLLFRQKSEDYKDVAEKIVPDILVEDDCKSIGSKDEMMITHVRPDIKKRIKSIVVKEGCGRATHGVKAEEMRNLNGICVNAKNKKH
jgi:hypothetical protein